jgi:hypothetical protein
MNAKHIGFLGIATLVILVGTFLVKMNQTASVSDTVLGGRFFADLEQRVNEITTIEIVKGPTKITLARLGEKWVIRERADFPADIAEIRKLVVGLVGLKSVERKTSKAEQYEKLGVEDPAGVEATGVGVTLKDADGSVRAAAVIGNAYEGGDATRKMLYVRRLSEPQSWLVEGEIDVPVQTARWIEKIQVVDIFRSRMKSMKYALPSGEQYLIFRDTPDAKGFRYSPLPSGYAIRSQARLDDMASALEHVTPDDVVLKDATSFESGKTTFGEYRTFDGVVVKSQLIGKDDRWIATYTVAIAEGTTPTEEVRKEVEALQPLSAWAFVIPEAKARTMSKPNDDVLVKAGK